MQEFETADWAARWLPRALPLHHTVLGGQGGWVLLLHGLFGAGDNLGGLGRELAESCRVVLVDLRNHGRSPHSEAMNLPLLAADIAALQDRLGIDRAALVGHSLGGKVAMELALNLPERVDRLVVADIAPVCYPPHHQIILAALAGLELQTLSSRGEADSRLAASIDEPGVRQFLLKSLYRDDSGFHWRFDLAALRDCYSHLSAAPQGLPFAGPTLFIKGERSDYIKPEFEMAMRAAFPHFQFRMIAGAGHWLHAERPVAFNRLVRQFLAPAHDADAP